MRYGAHDHPEATTDRGRLGSAPLFGTGAESRQRRASTGEWQRTWLRQLVDVSVAAGITVLLMFLAWEVIEQGFATGDDELAHLFHYSRGISTSLLTAAVVVWLSLRQHRVQAVALEAEIERQTRESRRARRLLQLVVDATPASLVVLDGQHRIVQANRTAERVHGNGITGVHCQDALKCESSDCSHCFVSESVLQQTSLRAPRLHRDPRTGEILEVESHPLRLDEGDDHALLVENVVTERKKLEARLLHQEKMAAFGLFAAEVAHDLGNPLCSIDAQLQLVDDEELPADARDAVVLVRQEVRRLHRVLRELVNFARKRREEATLVSVTGVVEDALRLLRHDRRMRGVQVVRDFGADVPPAHLVEDHLMQVVMNLLMNALDAMPDGGVLRLEVHPHGDGLAVRVRDDGVGMTPEVLDRCTEALFTTKEEGKGTGLGLSIARDILQAAGGELEMHSSVGRGTVAVVTLPAAGDRSERATAAEPVATAAEVAGGSSRAVAGGTG